MGLGIRRSIRYCRKVLKDYREEAHKRRISDKAKIVYDLDRHYEHVFRIKDDTYETVTLSEVYKFSRQTKLEAFSPAMDIYDLGKASVYCGSDVILTEDGAVWDKAYSPLFSKTVPFDSNIIDYNENYVWVKKNSKQKYLAGGGYNAFRNIL